MSTLHFSATGHEDHQRQAEALLCLQRAIAARLRTYGPLLAAPALSGVATIAESLRPMFFRKQLRDAAHGASASAADSQEPSLPSGFLRKLLTREPKVLVSPEEWATDGSPRSPQLTVSFRGLVWPPARPLP